MLIPKPLLVILFTLVCVGCAMAVFVNSYTDPGAVVSEQRVQVTVLEVATAELQGRYTGESRMHVGRVELPDGSEARVYFPTPPVIGDTIDMIVLAYEDGQREVRMVGALDW